MQALESFLVKLDTNVKDTMKTEGGLELFIDTRFNEFEHRVTEGPILSTPLKHNTGAKPGDTLFFHHLVVLNKGQLMPGESDVYMVNYDPDIVINNQAIAYRCQDTGDVVPLAGWALIEPFEEEEEQTEEGFIEVVQLEEKPVTKGVVSFRIDELDLDKGSVVGFKKNRDYGIQIDGKTYYRIAISQLLYQELQDS